MRRRYHPTLPLLLYCTMTVIIALVAMNGGFNLLFWIFGVMIASLIVSGFVSGGMMMRVRANRVLGGPAVVGEPFVVRYRLRNTARLLPVFGINFEERPLGRRDRRRGLSWDDVMAPAPAWVMHAGPRETVHGEAVLLPRRRGIAHFDELRLSTVFPFGIVRKSVATRRQQRLYVFPRRYRLRRAALSTVAPPGLVGSRISSHAGAGDDYYGLREYRRGDSMRHISWRRTASRDELVSIERTRPSPPRIRFVLNLVTPTDDLRVAADEPVPARELEERAISLCASFVHTADELGYEIGLTVLGLPVATIPVKRDTRHRDSIMASLAEIDLDADREQRPAPVEPETISEHAGVIAIHPDRVDVSVVHGQAQHYTARQLEHLVVPGGSLDAMLPLAGGAA